MTVQQALLEATRKLKNSSTPALDAELLLASVLRTSRDFLFIHPEKKLSSAQRTHYRRLVVRRQTREPIAYILGHKEFFGLDLLVNKNVLVPRPDTEVLVETVINLMRDKRDPKIVDIGVGSGAIAIALKKNIPQAKVFGTDVSQKALSMARRNAKKHKTNIVFKYGSLLSPFSTLRFDCIVSNPPYLTTQEMKNPDLCFEPKGALYGGRKGLEVYSRLLSQAGDHLTPKGCIVLEIGYNQAQPIIKLTKQLLPGSKVQVKKDLAGFARVLVIQVSERSGSVG